MKLLKAILLALLALFGGAVVMGLMFWTKGLFAILMVFGILVWFMHEQLSRHERMKARRR